MKKLVDIKRFKFYLWAGLAFLLLGMFTDAVSNPETFAVRAVDDAWRTIYVTIVNYILFEYTWPKLSRKRIFNSLLLIAFHIFLYAAGLSIWRYIGIKTGIYTAIPLSQPLKDVVGGQMGYGIGSFLFFGIARHLYHHRKLKRNAQQLLIEKQAAELNYLKSQTNPHFLFNTLNNIYSLARDKSDLAPESILRLSKILRYMLYEASGEHIAIEQEIKIMGDYIGLEKLRYDDTLHVNFNYDIEDMKQALSPLLLVPLVENAFKHGVSETRGRPYVKIHLSVKNRQLAFSIKNSTGDVAEIANVKENIGLSNLRRQLQLLYTDYSLTAQQEAYEFTTVLKINLASHV